MKNPLTQYRSEHTPFLNRVRITDNPIGEFRKIGFGPRLDKIDKEWAEESEGILISTYIDSWIRGKLYLHAHERGFKSVGNCGCTLIDQKAQRYPLRADDAGELVNPMVIQEGVASVSFKWLHAPQEFVFEVNQDVVELDGSVNRELVGDCFRFEIELSIHIPNDSVCVDIVARETP